ncbi:hypothetical protein IQ230_04310 [Gloeocapsopsis crepidinum LEGE 06123]|uniref:Uncharacterized protein n=1 Tax=Gloeocapsopsis crepidinum LEGE 06123 TaxID=588587 RepID=A0ABR9UMU7_9CHRO|nr:hypothetical protein [Gloeocapsopsis crepidinum LEGE 06123]
MVTLSSIPLAAVIGIAYILFGFLYVPILIAQLITVIRNSQTTVIEIAFRLTQFFVAPVILLLSGGILIFQGWRLDPMLVFQQILLLYLMAFLVVRDIQRLQTKSKVRTIRLKTK